VVKSEAEARAELFGGAKYETTFIPIRGVEWGGDPVGFFAYREKPPEPEKPTTQPQAQQQKPPPPTTTTNFPDSVMMSFRGYKDAYGNPATMNPVGPLLVSSDQVVAAGNFVNKPSDPTYRDVIDRMEAAVKPGEEVMDQPDPPLTVRDIVDMVETQRKAGKPTKYFSIQVGPNTYHYGTEMVIRAFKSFSPRVAVKGYIDSQQALVLVDNNRNFVAIAPVVGGDPADPAVANAIKIGGRP